MKHIAPPPPIHEPINGQENESEGALIIIIIIIIILKKREGQSRWMAVGSVNTTDSICFFND
jgi:hypothetical protein